MQLKSVSVRDVYISEWKIKIESREDMNELVLSKRKFYYFKWSIGAPEKSTKEVSNSVHFI